VGIRQLERLDIIFVECKNITERYHGGFKDIPLLRLPCTPEGYRNNTQSWSI
jgi:dTDP-4-amino-4,6-dideoxygalactose transaminase